MGTPITGPFTFKTRQFYDANGTNTAKDSTLTFEELDETLLSLSASVTNTAAVLEQQVTPTLGVGGYDTDSILPEGMTFTQFVVGLLTPYQPPTISDLTLKDSNNNNITLLRELGNDFEAYSIGLTANDDSNGAFPRSASITWTGNDEVNETNLLLTSNILSSTNTISLDGPYTFNRNTSGSISFTVTSKRPDNITNIVTSNTSTYRMLSILSGYPSATIPGNQQTFYNALLAETGESTALNSSAAWNVGGNAAAGGNPSRGNYPYYLFNNNFTVPTQFQYNAGTAAVSSAWTNLGTITVNNSYGVSVTLRVLRGNDPEGYPPGATLNFL
jgi:hypothetical protein